MFVKKDQNKNSIGARFISVSVFTGGEQPHPPPSSLPVIFVDEMGVRWDGCGTESESKGLLLPRKVTE